MTLRTGGPPYFDRLLQRLAMADPGAGAAFGRHVHWGYWSEPAQAGLGVEEYGRAAEALCLTLLNCTNVRDGLRILDVGCGFGGTIACLNERYSRTELIGVNKVGANNHNRAGFLFTCVTIHCRLPLRIDNG